MRRGQVTFLLIVAALLVFSAFFIFYLFSFMTTDARSEGFGDAESRAAARICLEEAGKQAVLGALREGGVNKDYWNELGNDAVTTDPGEEYLSLSAADPVRVWVFRGRDRMNYWPDPSTRTITIPPTSNVYAGPFVGMLKTEPLCAVGEAGNCLPETVAIPGGEPSWEEGIENRIANAVNAASCGITTGIDVSIGNDDVTITSGTESVTVPIRLKRLYNLGYQLAKYEMADPSFDPGTVNPSTVIKGCQDPGTGSDCAIQGLTVSATSIEDLAETDMTGWWQNATLVTITDTTTRIDGTNPQLRFVVRNRYPVLNNVSYAPDGVRFDIAEFDGRPVQIACQTNGLLTECGPTTVKPSTETWTIDSNFCAENPGRTTVRVSGIYCSEPSDPSTAKIPSGWDSLLTSTPPGAIPPDCKFFTADVPTNC